MLKPLLMMKKTSMLYWWPKIRDLKIPVPKTEIITVPYNDLVGLLNDKRLSLEYEKKIIEAGDKVGYPLFLRTDMSSAKHQWERTCFVPKVEDIFKHIRALIDETLTAGIFGELDPNALVFREFLHLYSTFTAFSGLPIARERRYFIRDGVVECHHAYWIYDAIERGWGQRYNNWRQLLFNLNREHKNEIKLLTSYAKRVAEVLRGYWSVDFACSKSRTWYLIDMAEGEKSWHPEHSKHSEGDSQPNKRGC